MPNTERETDPAALSHERATVTALRGALERVQRQLEQETREKHQALRELHDARVNLRALVRPGFTANAGTPPGTACVG